MKEILPLGIGQHSRYIQLVRNLNMATQGEKLNFFVLNYNVKFNRISHELMQHLVMNRIRSF